MQLQDDPQSTVGSVYPSQEAQQAFCPQRTIVPEHSLLGPQKAKHWLVAGQLMVADSHAPAPEQFTWHGLSSGQLMVASEQAYSALQLTSHRNPGGQSTICAWHQSEPHSMVQVGPMEQPPVQADGQAPPGGSTAAPHQS